MRDAVPQLGHVEVTETCLEKEPLGRGPMGRETRLGTWAEHQPMLHWDDLFFLAQAL